MQRKYDLAVFVGRFQPVHHAHINTIKHALSIADRVLICIGSVNAAPNIKNPWSFDQRREMIRECFDERDNIRIQFEGIEDNLYNDDVWVSNVQRAVSRHCDASYKVCIVGSKKDDSSFYLDLFPSFDLVELDVVSGFDATRIRDALFHDIQYNCAISHLLMGEYDHLIPHEVCEYLYTWIEDEWEEASRLSNEFIHIRNYKDSWVIAPYPPTFVTVDAVVTCAGHVLMVQRKAAPGQGLLALPGGFVDQHEKLINACIRELREETRIKVPEAVLKGSIVGERIFDHPNRSLRGRTITYAYHIALKDTTLPVVKGGDDAAAAYWMPMSRFKDSEFQRRTYEDHSSIVKYFTGV